ncbi:MAG TPA: SBBP repeat-containing protein, partial [Acidobacteriota bacterium]|nr:SBBP repeat-containing protein [Acidobacteriota bacterium]
MSGSTTNSPAAEPKAKEVDPAVRAFIEQSYGKLPLSFEVNNGQADDAVKYICRGHGYTLFLTSGEAVLSLGRGSLRKKDRTARRIPEAEESKPVAGDVVRLKIVGANPNTKISGIGELPGKSNYFIGNDPANWHTGVPNFEKVKIEGVYPGIDLVYYGNQRQLEYDWIVNPGADPGAIKFEIGDKANLKVDAQGNLILDQRGGLRLQKPFIYQQSAGSRKEITGRYIILENRQVSFQMDKYDASLPLVIDPVLNYSVYLGGSSLDYGQAIAVDSSGSAYVTGATFSTNFPTATPFHAISGGGFDAFVTKLNSSGNALLYSTYLGGNDTDVGYGIAVDASGNAYVTGETLSTNFPTANPVQGNNRGADDAFVTKLNASGNALTYSTYLGGSDNDSASGIAVDSSGNVYVTGETLSTNFPMANPLQASNGGSWDVFVTKLNSSGSALLYSTYLGGSNTDNGNAIAVDSSGNAYVTGFTISTNFPTAHAFQASSGGNNDAFITKLNSSGSALLYSTYLGGSNADYGNGIAVDSSGNAYVTGSTTSTNFPTAHAFQASFGGYSDAFITKLNSSGSALLYSTYFGGSNEDYGRGIAVDLSGNVYLTGETLSTNFPTRYPLQANYGGNWDAFITKLNSSGSGLFYSTYLGGSDTDEGYGIAVDTSGTAYVTGETLSTNFPTLNKLQASYGGSGDTFVAKMIFAKTFGDVDGDGKADVAVWRPSNGLWFILPSGSPGTYTTAQWGEPTDILV